MAWTAPRTWAPGDLLGSATLNAEIRDNLLALATPPGEAIKYGGGNKTTGSTTFVDMDATNLKISLTQFRGAVALSFNANFTHDTNAAFIYVDFVIDSVRYQTSNNGSWLTRPNIIGEVHACQIDMVVSGLSVPGSHEFKVQWRTSAGTATLLSNGSGGYASFSARQVF